MLLRIHPSDPQERLILQVADCLKKGGVIIYPTDTIYGLGCDIYNQDAIKRICRIKNVDVKKSQFSFVCSDLSHISQFAKSMDTPLFRMLKKAWPGPFTFILEASKEVPKLMKTKKETVGIRVPDNKICHSIIKALGHPIISASLPMDADVEYFTDPEEIHEKFFKLVDMVIDGGPGNLEASTIIDCTGAQPEVIREGAGNWQNLFS
jgi:tRNA threonylcarbamoyl adenosine modification protein (Sua5/YciO/YrdC/YwlC family)